jgi:hypothetical protein
MNVDTPHARGTTTVDFASRQDAAAAHQTDALRRRRFHRARERARLAYPGPPPPSHRLDVRSWTVTARTQLTLAGKVDAAAIKALRRAIDHAQSEGHEVSLDVSEVVAIAREARLDLIGLAYRLALAAEEQPREPRALP